MIVTFNLQLSPTSGLILLIQVSLKYTTSLERSHGRTGIKRGAVFHKTLILWNKNIHFLESLGHDDATRQVFYCLTWSLHSKRLDLRRDEVKTCQHQDQSVTSLHLVLNPIQQIKITVESNKIKVLFSSDVTWDVFVLHHSEALLVS